MTVNFHELLPSIQPALEGLAQIPLIRYVNETVWIFALVETGHLLFLTILGGSVFALNLRILGLVLSSVPTQDVERAVRPWYHAGVIGTLATGIAMATTTARTLMPSEAFFIKMVALVAAILLSNVVAREVRSGQAASSRAGALRVMFALLLWSFALVLFGSTAGLNSGGILIALAGGALLSVAAHRRQRPFVIGLSVIGLAAWFAFFNGVSSPHDNAGQFAWIGNGVIAAITIAPALGATVREVRASSSDASSGDREAARKLTAFASTLAWVTVAAAGRWIGFS